MCSRYCCNDCLCFILPSLPQSCLAFTLIQRKIAIFACCLGTITVIRSQKRSYRRKKGRKSDRECWQKMKIPEKWVSCEITAVIWNIYHIYNRISVLCDGRARLKVIFLSRKHQEVDWTPPWSYRKGTSACHSYTPIAGRGHVIVLLMWARCKQLWWGIWTVQYFMSPGRFMRWRSVEWDDTNWRSRVQITATQTLTTLDS